MKKRIIRILVVFAITVLGFPAGAKAGQAPDPACPNEPMVRRILIELEGKDNPRKEKLSGMAARLIRLKPGDCLSDDALFTSIDLLKQSGQFSRIDVPDPDWQAARTDLTIFLTPAPLVRKIRVRGAFPVFRSEVINRTDYKVGSPFLVKTVEKSIRSIEELMKERGYIDPKADIFTQERENGNVSVNISVEKGPFYRIDHVELTGNERFSDTRLKLRMKTFQIPGLPKRFRRFIKAEPEADVRTLTEFYRKKGYAEVEITSKIRKNPSKQTAEIRFLIQEGPEYRVRFTGHEEFTGFTLKRRLVFQEKGNLHDFGIKRSIKNIRALYVSAGYPDVRIVPESRIQVKKGRAVRHVTFRITENTQHLVEHIRMKGGESFPAKTLEKEVLTGRKHLFSGEAFVQETLEEDRQALEHFYRMNGFENAEVKPRVQWTPDIKNNIKYADILFHIEEGIQSRVEDVRFKGVEPGLARTLKNRISIRPGDPFYEEALRRDRQTILSTLAEDGFLYCRVDPQVPDAEDGTGRTVVFSIEKEKPVTVGGVWTFGAFKTRESVLRRKTEIEAGDRVSLSEYTRFKKEVWDTECINGAEFKVLGLKDRLDEFFFITEVEEKRPYFVEASLGYDTARDAYASLKAGDRNLLGKNREFSVDASWSGIGYDTGFELTGYDLFHLDVETRFRTYLSKEEKKNQAFGTRTRGSLFTVQRDFFETVTAGSRFGLESREQYRTKETVDYNREFDERRTIFTFSPFGEINRAYPSADPENGYYAGVFADYTKDVDQSLDDFIRYRASFKYYKKIAPRVVLAFKGMYGRIVNFADESDLPEDQLFYLGGLSSVRGYEENMLAYDALKDPAGGKEMISGTMEARIDLGLKFEMPVFIDTGTLLDTRTDTVSEEVKWTVGTGLRYMTPIGPIGLLYGRKLNPEPDEAKGRFHFSIGYAF